MNKETKEKLEQLQNLEQNINSILSQRQQFQSQQLEIENAMEQVKDTEKVFRIIGNIMVASKKEEVKKELREKLDIVELRLKTLEKQEAKFREKASELQKDVMKEIK
ncbi:TPA: prefoldin subunit beta [Candidatus Woesearchaeota archaeon]|nr:Prefoldin subunit beta [archaeon GW2011_AR15]MBS3103626.1 prefoldin subunit beta [Candidatus Woesearchaeota archaeon]HIH41774.1 prefoldin subunit beta [Candidatus Woesearchaeota archaeon]